MWAGAKFEHKIHTLFKHYSRDVQFHTSLTYCSWPWQHTNQSWSNLTTNCLHILRADRLMEPGFQYFYPDYSSDLSLAQQMANFLLNISGEEAGKIPTVPSSEVLEACKYVHLSVLNVECWDGTFSLHFGLLELPSSKYTCFLSTRIGIVVLILIVISFTYSILSYRQQDLEWHRRCLRRQIGQLYL